MSLPYFLARRIYGRQDHRRGVSRPAVTIATLGITIGLAVMIVTIGVVTGFKHTIQQKVIGFGSHIQVVNFLSLQSTDPLPVCINDSLVNKLKHLPNIQHVERYAVTQGILKTDSDFLGVAFKGISADYDTTFLAHNLVSGRLPQFGTAEARQQLLLSQLIANKLKLKSGDKVYAYFISANQVRARKFTVTGIYQTNVTQFDQQLCFTDLHTAQRLNQWEADQVSGAELRVTDYNLLNQTADYVSDAVNRHTDPYGDIYTSQTIQEAYPNIFSWLSLMDINVWIILALMTALAGFTMISGLLIIILERTQMIGLLSALGANNNQLRRTFLWLAFFIIGRALVFGNLLGIGLLLIQQHFGLVHLDPQTYYVSRVPVEISLSLILLLSVATLIITLLALLLPARLVSNVHPAQAMRYE